MGPLSSLAALVLLSHGGMTGSQALSRAKSLLHDLGITGELRVQELSRYSLNGASGGTWAIKLTAPGKNCECALRDTDGKVMSLAVSPAGKGEPLAEPKLRRNLERIVDRFRGETAVKARLFRLSGGRAWAEFDVSVNGLEFFNGSMIYSASVDASTGSFLSYRTAPDLPASVPAVNPHLSLAQAEAIVEKHQATVPAPKPDNRRPVMLLDNLHHGLRLGYMLDSKGAAKLVWLGYFAYPWPDDASKRLAGMRVVIDAKTGVWLKDIPS